MPGKTVSITDTISNVLPKIFDQSQNTTANHQKNRVALYKLHQEAALHVESVQNGKGIKLVGERAFEIAFIDMVNHVLQVKKGVSVADRVVKFIGGYVGFLNEKASQDKTDEDQDDDDMASRFVARLMKHLIKGFLAKDKNVRYRILQMVSELIFHLGEIDDEVYAVLRACLLDRTKDKEPFVRVQAAIALSKLAGSESPDDLGEGELDAQEVLIDMVQYDPAAEVRRAVLLNLPVNDRTTSAILSRTRDTDDVIRKMVYSHVLMNLETPKKVTIADREIIVRNGLGDRQGPVRAAAGKLIASWVDVADGNLIDFLDFFDLITSDVAEDALLSVFVTRPDIFDNVEFDESFWSELTPEKAFLIRVFVEHCKNMKDENRLESSLPVVTALAFKIQAAYNDLLEQIQGYEEARVLGEITEDEQEPNEEAKTHQEFIIAEMLRLAASLDYGDEIGRRKMFGLVRDMISQETIPEKLMERCFDVLRVLIPNEKDLIRLMVEIVHEIRDQAMPEPESEPEDQTIDAEISQDNENFPDMDAPAKTKELSPEEKMRKTLIDSRCLNLCIGVLERVNGSYEENPTLRGILGDLILPNLNSAYLQESVLICLGLCCLIDKRMAMDSFSLFMKQINKVDAAETLRIKVLKIVFDILMVYDKEILGAENGKEIVPFILQSLDTAKSPEFQAVVCLGVAKLMLSGMVSDENVLKYIVLAYISPDTKDNQEVRQCLSYFFHVYCYSSSVNQCKMQKIAIETYLQLSEEYSELEDTQDMIPPSQIALLFIDWTDPRNIMEMPNQAVNEGCHVDLAIDMLKAMMKNDTEKDDAKIFAQSLGKLYFPDDVDMSKIQTVKLLVNKLQRHRLPKDATTKNAIARFDKAIEKRFAEQLENFNEEDLRKLEDLEDLFSFLDNVFSDDEDMPPHPKKRAAAARVKSEATASSDSEGSTPVPSKGKGRVTGKAKTATVPETPRTLPKRAAKSRPSIIADSETSSESNEESDSATPSPPHKRKARTSKEQPASKRKRDSEQALDNEINNLLEAEEDEKGEGSDRQEGREGSASEEESEVDDLLVSEDED
ncbi:hypothetical protein M422DRAFT_38823 [Sphaerobolus stellatus SS14]|uniref:Unplaced genomic scaffold SPHSTscaffold_345, whole genome shotgun sequence n=1 Tax=Sphaerobolus stellatus (strain SS14) TaxID=990650 RepID=A0A0C9TTY9_SPHS4|nr:hypothetical protein M422DRAFT_38823 [Sphaerobolus stellatus SS14]